MILLCACISFMNRPAAPHTPPPPGRLRGDACRTLCAKFCVAVCLPALCRVQDTRFKWKTKLAGGAALTIKQHVPGGNWALIPNPGVPHCALLAAGCRPRAVQRGGVPHCRSALLRAIVKQRHAAPARERPVTYTNLHSPTVSPPPATAAAAFASAACPAAAAEFELSRSGVLGKHGKLVAGYDFME